MTQEIQCVICRVIADNHPNNQSVCKYIPSPLFYRGYSLCKAHFRYLIQNKYESVDRFDEERAINAMEGLNY